MMTIRIKKLHPEARVPEYKSFGAAGADLCAVEKVHLWPGESTIVRTGLAIEVPVGYEAQIRPRSGLAAEHNITVLNSPGTIDADYRGEIKVILMNHGKTMTFEAGERIAQLVIAPVVQGNFIVADELSTSSRGDRGFGSTGTTG